MTEPTPAPAPIGEALRRWRSERRLTLDAAQGLCLAAAPSTAATDLAIGTYVSALSAQFQRFCADLLSDLTDTLIGGVSPNNAGPVTLVIRGAMTADRALDRGNPTLASLDRDFGRYGIRFSAALRAVDPTSDRRLQALSVLLRVRNAVAHATAPVSTLGPGGAQLTVLHVDAWRTDFDLLAATMDRAVRDFLRIQLNIESR